MRKNITSPDNTITQMLLAELRQKWAEAWGISPHSLIGRTMLEKSLAFKLSEQDMGGLSEEQQARLEQLMRTYKRNPKCFDANEPQIKPGTRIVKVHNGMRHSLLVLSGGFEYKGVTYRSLSQIATLIAGCRRNGWEFFGLKRKGDGK